MRAKKTPKFPVHIRAAVDADIAPINKIARKYSRELGFVMRVALQESIARGTLLVAEYEEHACVGFVNYRTRKDGWSTIYEIAVDPVYTGKGIGRFLVDAVPCPTRLKCTVDNSANAFYKKSHFKPVRVEQGRKRKLKVWERKTLYILCKGGSKTADETVKELYVTYGTRHTEKPHQQPFFVDIKWDDYDWFEYLMKLRLWKPVFAMVPDFMELDQKEFMLQAVQDIKDAGVLRVGVCPKFDGAVQHIPEDCTVCVSIPSRHAGFLPNPKELIGRKLHLLGGSPTKQYNYIKEHPELCVVSEDTNSHMYAAKFGGSYMYKNNEITRVDCGGLSYLQTIKQSTQQIYKALDSL